jgi:hypothetical protein
MASMFATCSVASSPHGAAVVGVDAEPLQLHARRRFTGAELHPSVGNEVERRDPFGDAGRVVVLRRHEHDAVAETDALRALGGGGQEHLRRGGMRVLLEEVVLHLPGGVDAKLVGELHLFEGILEELQLSPWLPRAGELVLVEDAELHRGPLFDGLARTAFGLEGSCFAGCEAFYVTRQALQGEKVSALLLLGLAR